jgi:hypothetical protein
VQEDPKKYWVVPMYGKHRRPYFSDHEVHDGFTEELPVARSPSFWKKWSLWGFGISIVLFLAVGVTLGVAGGRQCCSQPPVTGPVITPEVGTIHVPPNPLPIPPAERTTPS